MRTRDTLRVLGLLAGLTATPLLAVELNDTGQVDCFTATSTSTEGAAIAADGGSFPRQDCRYGRDAAATDGVLTKSGNSGVAGFDFTMYASDGVTETTDPASAHCVMDHTTGLMWEAKSNDGGLRDKDWFYTWYDTDSTINGGSPGNIGTSTACGSTLTNCNTSAYVAAVNSSTLCGQSDWRMPTKRELLGLAEYGNSTGSLPAIDNSVFLNTTTSGLWSASSYAPATGNAWTVSGLYGSASADTKSQGLRIRLVRGVQF